MLQTWEGKSVIRSTLIFAAIAMVPLVAGVDPETAFLIFVGSMTCSGIWLFLRVCLFGGNDINGDLGVLWVVLAALLESV